MVGLLLGEVVSAKTIAHHHRGCGWLASTIRLASIYNPQIEAKSHVTSGGFNQPFLLLRGLVYRVN